MAKRRSGLYGKKILICISLTILSLLSFAQNEMQEINEIKSNINFLYATGSSTISVEEATDNARELIKLEIEQWLSEQFGNNYSGYVVKSRDSLSLIKTRRGNLYRAFVFVKKNDILPCGREENVLIVDVSQAETDNCFENSHTFLQKNNNSTTVVHTQNSNVEETVYVPSQFEQSIMTIVTFNALNNYVNNGRESGSILNVGNYKNLPTAGKVYAFIHNRDGKIQAYLRIQDCQIVNLSTGMEDAISNYKGCGAIWIQVKEE